MLAIAVFEVSFQTIFVNLKKFYSMRKANLTYLLGAIIVIMFAFQACKKSNGIDNNIEIQKPYSLYIGTEQGALLNTNDGVNFKTIFPADGFKTHALATAGTNILMVKGNVHLSEDNGKNFNPTYLDIYSFYLNFTKYVPWQQGILYSALHNRIYIISKYPKGIAYSEDNGKTWIQDVAFGNGINNNVITSFTSKQVGQVYAHNASTDSLYFRTLKTDNWTHVGAMAGLPSASGHIFYLGHYGNDLLLTDLIGNDGVYTSNDNGANWTAMSGLPTKHILHCNNAPFDKTILVGTDSMGIYRWNGTAFVPSSAGLADYTVVYSIVGKEDLYKNGVTKQYVYAATNKGLYKSEDLGVNWVLVLPGGFVNVY